MLWAIEIKLENSDSIKRFNEFKQKLNAAILKLQEDFKENDIEVEAAIKANSPVYLTLTNKRPG